MGCVYLAKNTINGKVYVGKTIHTLRHRRTGHEKDAASGGTQFFHRALNKYGFASFSWSVLFESDNEELLLDEEKWFIRVWKSTNSCHGYNLMDAGNRGFSSHSEESKRKTSRALKGRQKTKEHIAKVAKALLGKKFSASHRQSIRDSHLGKKRSEEAKAKTSATLTGKAKNSSIHMVAYRGKTQTFMAWTKELGLKYTTLWWRVRSLKQPFDVAVSIMIQKKMEKAGRLK